MNVGEENKAALLLLTLVTEMSLIRQALQEECIPACTTATYLPSWSKLKKNEYLHNDITSRSVYFDSAPCPPPWNISLLCDYYNNRSCLDCNAKTQLLGKCLDENFTENILSIFKKCSRSLKCDSFVTLCRHHTQNTQGGNRICPETSRKKPRITPNDHKPTRKTSSVHDTSKELFPVPGDTMEFNSSFVMDNATMEYNTTANGTVIITPDRSAEASDVSSHVHSSDLSVLWFLLILPYCFIIVPCFVHFCIKRRKKRAAHLQTTPRTQDAKKSNGTVSGEEPLISPTSISTVTTAAQLPNSENRKSIGDMFDDWHFIDEDSDQHFEENTTLV